MHRAGTWRAGLAFGLDVEAGRHPLEPTQRASDGPATATRHVRTRLVTTYSPGETAVTANSSPCVPTRTRPSASTSTGVVVSPCRTMNRACLPPQPLHPGSEIHGS